jgi:hypothetical protein
MRFMVLTGHLDDYSLPGLIKLLHGQRKTGRLQIEYTESPAAFYFEEGRLVDAKIGELRGLEALYLALSLPGASFNFNPLIKPPERTFEEREQKFIQGLLEAPAGGGALDASTLLVGGENRSQVSPPAHAPALLQAANSPSALPALVEERLMSEVGAALATHSRRFSRERAVYATVIGALLLITFISTRRNQPAPASVSSHDVRPEVSAPATPAEVARSEEISKESAPIVVPPQAVAREAGEERAREQPLNTTDPNAANGKERSGRQSKAPNVSPAQKGESKTERRAASAAQSGQVVRVLMRVERGRVLQAAVQNSRPGMESFEALALRMARQRQYPRDFSGRDVLQIKVKP